MFNNAGRIGADRTDNTQRTLQNTRFANHMLSSYFNESISSENIEFASKQPTMLISGLARGDGLNGKVVDYDSLLLIKTTQDRPQEKLQLMQRPFLTVPYLGRGSCNPDTESQLLQGESTWDKKGVSVFNVYFGQQYGKTCEKPRSGGKCFRRLGSWRYSFT
jgi:hypothetical protein